MRRYFMLTISVALVCLLTSCGNNGQPSSGDTAVPNNSLTIQAGKEWLKNSIETFFNNDDEFLKGYSSLCTEQYAEFKKDATNVDMDGGMTEDEFKSKWGRRYSQYAGIGEGFMIAGNDFGTIEVTQCDFRNMTEMKNFLYDVVIVDKTFNSTFTRQVVLVKNGDSFLIDDVKEIKNEFQITQ